MCLTGGELEVDLHMETGSLEQGPHFLIINLFLWTFMTKKFKKLNLLGSEKKTQNLSQKSL